MACRLEDIAVSARLGCPLASKGSLAGLVGRSDRRVSGSHLSVRSLLQRLYEVRRECANALENPRPMVAVRLWRRVDAKQGQRLRSGTCQEERHGFEYCLPLHCPWPILSGLPSPGGPGHPRMVPMSRNVGVHVPCRCSLDRKPRPSACLTHANGPVRHLPRSRAR